MTRWPIFSREETKVQISVFGKRIGDNHLRKESKNADVNKKQDVVVYSSGNTRIIVRERLGKSGSTIEEAIIEQIILSQR